MSTITSMTPPGVSAPTPASTPAQPSISIQDLQNLLIIVDLATSRGAFRGTELSQVGQVFDRLNQFLQSVVPPPDQQNNPGQANASAPTPIAPTPIAPTPMAPTPMAQASSPTQATPTPVMPMVPPFTPKVGV